MFSSPKHKLVYFSCHYEHYEKVHHYIQPLSFFPMFVAVNRKEVHI